MGRTFRGESHHKVDNKGRVSIPALFRRVVEAGDPGWSPGGNPELVIVYGDERRDYLECFTVEAIERVDVKISRLPRASLQRKSLQRLYSGQAHPATVDETGRLVLPKKLRDKVAITDSAFFIGNGDTFEIWNYATYEVSDLADGDDGYDPAVDPAIYLPGEED